MAGNGLTRVKLIDTVSTAESVIESDGAFVDLWLLTTPSPRALEHSMNALWAAKQSGVRRVVRMSAIGAAHDAPTRNGRLHALSDAELLRDIGEFVARVLLDSPERHHQKIYTITCA